MKAALWKQIVAVIVFWVLVCFGGVLLLLLNALSFARYRPGELGYLVMSICANAFGAASAMFAAYKITEEKHPVLCLVNSVLGVAIVAIITLLGVLLKTLSVSNIISNALMVIVFIVGSIVFAEINRSQYNS